MKGLKIISYLCIIWGTIFAFLYTNYFGNNWFPKTVEELICDITALLLIITGYYLNKKLK